MATLAIVALASGCSAPVQQKKKVEIFWPKPPIQPRIMYVDYFRTAADVSGRGQGSLGKMLGKSSASMFKKPYGIAVTPDGRRLFVADHRAVVSLDLQEGSVSRIGTKPGDGQVSWPFGITVTPSGKLYVTDLVLNTVFVFDLDGKYLRKIGGPEVFDRPTGIGVDEERDRIYVVDSKINKILIFNLDGEFQKDLGLGAGNAEGAFYFPSNITLARDGTIYVTDTGNFRIQAFSPEGEFIRAWGSVGDSPGFFARPKGISTDSEGNVYVVDAAFQNVQVFSREGRLLMWFAEAGRAEGRLSLPSTVAIDENDRIYVLEQVQPRIQVFQYLGENFFSMFPEEKIRLEEKLKVSFVFGQEQLEAPSAEEVEDTYIEPSEALETGTEGDGQASTEEPAPVRETAVSPEGSSKEAALLIQMLEFRFGPLSEQDRKRVEDADRETLQRWGSRVLGAEDVNAVFAE